MENEICPCPICKIKKFVLNKINPSKKYEKD